MMQNMDEQQVQEMSDSDFYKAISEGWKAAAKAWQTVSEIHERNHKEAQAKIAQLKAITDAK